MKSQQSRVFLTLPDDFFATNSHKLLE
ncbi:MAG: hypothetical protein ACJAT4_001307, partial [Granulosicoccus sp.]